MSTPAPDRPQFDDVRKALSFALNLKSGIKSPAMSTAMARVGAMKKRPTKPALRRLLRGADDATTALILELVEHEFGRHRTRRTPAGPPRLKGLDEAHMAGYILAHFGRLVEEQRVVLEGVAITAYDRCACRAPCCSGWARNLQWAQAVRRTCELLQHAGDVLKEPGKRGLSTQPALRLALVEQYFTRNDLKVTEAASIGNVSMLTAARHKEWVTAWLKQAEDEAWTRLAVIFDDAGITGTFD